MKNASKHHLSNQEKETEDLALIGLALRCIAPVGISHNDVITKVLKSHMSNSLPLQAIKLRARNMQTGSREMLSPTAKLIIERKSSSSIIYQYLTSSREDRSVWLYDILFIV